MVLPNQTAVFSTPDAFVDYYDNASYDFMNETHPGFMPPQAAPLVVWLPTVLVYSITFMIGLVGNVLVIFAIQRCRRLQNVTNSFLASLATADLIIIVIVIPFQTPTYFSYKWELGEFMCKMLTYLTLLSSSCSVFMLTAMSIERYFVIVHPLLAKSVITLGRARKVIISVWLVAMVYSFPPLYSRRQIAYKNDGHPTYHTCHTYWPNNVLGKIYSIYLLLGMYLIPLFIMVYCYSRIIYELWISTKKSQQLQNRHACARRLCSNGPGSAGGGTNGVLRLPVPTTARTRSLDCVDAVDEQKQIKLSRRGDFDQGRKQVIVMLLVVVALFMLCWGPLIWLVFLIEFELVKRFSIIRTYLEISFNLFSYLNSCMNPICYAFISRTFRECFLWACRTCCHHTEFRERTRRSASLISKSTVTSLYSRSSLNRSSSTLRNSATTISSRQQSPMVENPPWNIQDIGASTVMSLRTNNTVNATGGESNV
ncbi:cholecystokinin receptor-like [Ptychodera flava]|uniref:cholecystokinin receptor-like n=1 Tax=Ptychodera flava TaxID=63121 RepID=UPI003969C2F5